MRDYLIEGDLISAEVQSVFSDGALSLHTRSLKYGKLGQGVLVDVCPSLVKRRKTHFHNLPCGASVIVGNNGYIWISPTSNEQSDMLAAGGFLHSLQPVASADRQVIARLCNCVLALAEHRMMLYDTSILYTYDACTQYQVKDLLRPEVMKEIVDVAKHRLDLES
jgi:exosome complex component RRP4